MLWVNPGATGNSHERLDAMKQNNRADGADANVSTSWVVSECPDNNSNYREDFVKSDTFSEDNHPPPAPEAFKSPLLHSDDEDAWAVWAAQHPECALCRNSIWPASWKPRLGIYRENELSGRPAVTKSTESISAPLKFDNPLGEESGRGWGSGNAPRFRTKHKKPPPYLAGVDRIPRCRILPRIRHQLSGRSLSRRARCRAFGRYGRVPRAYTHTDLDSCVLRLSL